MEQAELQQLKITLTEQVKEQMEALSTQIPSYEELSLKEKAMVEQYMEEVDVANPETIYQLGADEKEDIFAGLNQLLELIQTHDAKVETMFMELMIKIDENTKNNKPIEKSFIEQFKESPIQAFANLKNAHKKTAEGKKAGKQVGLEDIEAIREKIEGICAEFRNHAKMLENMAKESSQQYRNVQLQMVALQMMKQHVEGKQTANVSSTFSEIQETLEIAGIAQKITAQMELCQNFSVNVARKAIIAKLLVQYYEACAGKYEQMVLTTLPELTGKVVVAQANASLWQDVEMYQTVLHTMPIQKN